MASSSFCRSFSMLLYSAPGQHEQMGAVQECSRGSRICKVPTGLHVLCPSQVASQQPFQPHPHTWQQQRIEAGVGCGQVLRVRPRALDQQRQAAQAAHWRSIAAGGELQLRVVEPAAFRLSCEAGLAVGRSNALSVEGVSCTRVGAPQ